MIIRATQKKMMSKPVTSTDDGRNVRSSARVLRPAERRVAPQRRREPRVEHVLVLRERRRLAAELRARLRARVGLVARDVDVAVLVVPRRNRCPHQSWREMHQSWMLLIQWRYVDEPFARARTARARARRCAASAMPVADGGEAQVLDRLARERADASPARACSSRRTTGRSASARRLRRCARSAARPSCAPSRSREALRREVRQHRLARGVAIEPAILRRRVVVDRRVEIEDRDRREIVALPDLPSR